MTPLASLDKACLSGPIIAELLHGVRGKKEMAQLKFIFSTIPCLEINQNDWQTAGNTLRQLRDEGLAISLTDVLIASIAIRNNIPVLTLDKHFQHLAVECLEI